MNDKHIFQHFALTNNNHLIHIKETDNTNSQYYYCPHCHKEMIPKRGSIRQWHFAHKANQCSYDKYLHSIAEIMLMHWFNTSEHIYLNMQNIAKCDKYDSCSFRNNEDCTRPNMEQFDLKRYFFNCIPEHRHSNFVADLYCENRSNYNEPIFIEIMVTHECSQEKKESGIRIIELIIQSEEDILEIINSQHLTEGPTVRLYNFKRNISEASDFSEYTLQKYILYPSLKSYVDGTKTAAITCKNYNKDRKGIYEISIRYDDCIPYFLNSRGLYTVGLVKAYLEGLVKKDCRLCFWQEEDSNSNKFCKLYKKMNLPKYCKDNNASTCPYFKLNQEIVNTAKIEWDEYLQHNPVDIWRLD